MRKLSRQIVLMKDDCDYLRSELKETQRSVGTAFVIGMLFGIGIALLIIIVKRALTP